jgi:Protein of unknown function (DUF2480)
LASQQYIDDSIFATPPYYPTFVSMSEFVNKVAESGIITINLEHYIQPQDFITFDLKPFLFMEMILKEKDYREALKNNDWTIYDNKIVCITCSVDAIIPQWAFMLATTYLQPVAKDIRFGLVENIKNDILRQAINNINTADYADKRIVIKGCGDVQIPDEAYIAITQQLLPVAKSIMYGEPCSTVPIYKRKA